MEEISAADLVLHAGDISTAEALAEIEAIGTPLLAVHGNVESAELRSRLPAELSVELEGSVVALVHDAGPARARLARMRRRFPEADAVVFGHSHLPLHEQGEGFQIFNPGSPTERRRAPARTMGLLDAASGGLRFRHLRLH